MEFTFDIWYFTVISGQQEKEHERHTVVADTIEQAVEKARQLYRFVFSIYHGPEKVYRRHK